jgi:hypothetical protein
MLYAIAIIGDESRVATWTPAEESAVMSRHKQLREKLTADRGLGPVMRLQTTATKTVRRYADRKLITDGPFAETKEQLLGIYVVDVPSFEDAVAATEFLNFEGGVFEISPLTWLTVGVVPEKIPRDDVCSAHPRP